ncbi:hypothetical protein WMC59_03395 [Staphylococcus delphini]|uniref:hypothetical protein n=1 Tax=Staphylococcus delphini TaxID=53344 RepID=UPI00374E7CDA
MIKFNFGGINSEKIVVTSLATGISSPVANAKEVIKNNKHFNDQKEVYVNSEKIARESAKANGAKIRAYDSKQMERVKVTWTFKGAKAILSKNKN